MPWLAEFLKKFIIARATEFISTFSPPLSFISLSLTFQFIVILVREGITLFHLLKSSFVYLC